MGRMELTSTLVGWDTPPSSESVAITRSLLQITSVIFTNVYQEPRTLRNACDLKTKRIIIIKYYFINNMISGEIDILTRDEIMFCCSSFRATPWFYC